MGFATVASEAFSFSLDLGFELVELSDTFARYETDRRLMQVFHGRSSYELGVEVGRWIEVDGVRLEQAFPLRAVVAFWSVPVDIGFGGTSATSAELVRRFVGELAGWTREFALPFLVDGDELFDQLSAKNTARAVAEREELRATRLRRRADDAWRRKDLEAVVLAYTEIEQELNTVSLRGSERGRLAYAKNHGPLPS